MSVQLQSQSKTELPSFMVFVPPRLLQRKCARGQYIACKDGECEECKKKGEGILQRAAITPSPAHEIPPIVQDVLHSPGQPLDAQTRGFMEPRFGHDFSGVRVHANTQAAESARAVNALAYTVGRDVVFGAGQYAPETSVGQRLLAHELTHVEQQHHQGPPQQDLKLGSPHDQYEQDATHVADSLDFSPASRFSENRSFLAYQPIQAVKAVRDTTGVVQRQISPEDVSSEMIGARMTVSGQFTRGSIHLSGGETVEILSWSNVSSTAQVQLPTPHLQAFTPFDIPKRLLRPVLSGVSRIAPYSSGLEQTVRSIERGEQSIAAEQARPGGPRPGEIPRLEGLQRNREHLLNRRLIQEELLNRFDPMIRQWTDYYNRQFGRAGADALDPNLVKSMLFQESQMGTAGQHLEAAPSWPVRARFNIGQVIDSAAAALLIMMQEMQPALIAIYHLQNIHSDRAQAQQDLQTLPGIRTPTPAQTARLSELRRIETLARTRGVSFAETFMWVYKAAGQARGFNDAVNDFFAAGGATPRNQNYEFWIRTAIRWLFEKRRSVRSWEEAVRAYNGSGPRATRYRDEVRNRARNAAEAQRAGRDFIPPEI